MAARHTAAAANAVRYLRRLPPRSRRQTASRTYTSASHQTAAPLLGREADAPTSLAAALLGILIFDPFAIASVSLQLSFGAAAGLLLFSPGIHRVLSARYPSRAGHTRRAVRCRLRRTRALRRRAKNPQWSPDTAVKGKVLQRRHPRRRGKEHLHLPGRVLPALRQGGPDPGPGQGGAFTVSISRVSRRSDFFITCVDWCLLVASQSPRRGFTWI